MYKLIYMPGACSLAIHALLNELKQEVEIVDRSKVVDFDKHDSRGMVPVLIDNGQSLREGAAIILYLLEKHKNNMLPESGLEKARFVEWVMFANATLHPAYGRLFFLGKTLEEGPVKQGALNAAADAISNLWQAVERHLQDADYMFGDKISAVDFMLAVYASWGQYFPVDIVLGEKARRMIAAVNAAPAFVRAIDDEKNASV